MQNSPLLGTETDPGYVPTSEEKTLAILSHVLCLVAGFVAPLVIYLIKKDESPYVTAHAKESLNFQITLWIAIIILLIIPFLGWILLWVPMLVGTILVIIATIKASEAKLYRYPFSIRLIK